MCIPLKYEKATHCAGPWNDLRIDQTRRENETKASLILARTAHELAFANAIQGQRGGHNLMEKHSLTSLTSTCTLLVCIPLVLLNNFFERQSLKKMENKRSRPNEMATKHKVQWKISLPEDIWDHVNA